MLCFFHLVGRENTIRDETGTDVADLTVAGIEALTAVREMQQEDSNAQEIWQGWRLNVTDQTGQMLFSISLSATLQQTAVLQIQEQTASSLGFLLH